MKLRFWKEKSLEASACNHEPNSSKSKDLYEEIVHVCGYADPIFTRLVLR